MSRSQKIKAALKEQERFFKQFRKDPNKVIANSKPIQLDDFFGNSKLPRYAVEGLDEFREELYSDLISKENYSFINEYVSGMIDAKMAPSVPGYQLCYLFKDFLDKGVKIEHIQELIRCIQLKDYEHFLSTLTGDYLIYKPTWEFSIPHPKHPNEKVVINRSIPVDFPYEEYDPQDIDPYLLKRWANQEYLS